MTAEQKAAGYLGMAARAKLLVSGEFATEQAVKARKAKLVVLAGDASESTKKHFRDMCAWRDIPVIEMADRETLGHMIGRGFRASAALTDEHLADAVMKAVSVIQYTDRL